MKKKREWLGIALLLMVLVAWSGCKPDDPDDPNEEEVITKVQLTLTNHATGAAAGTVIYSDPDGDGGSGPTQFDTIPLDSGVVYDVRVALFDESDPQNVDNITLEVEEEGVDHLFCYTASGASVTVVRTDSDGTFPIGITSQWTAGGPGTGTMRVELRHQPGVKDGTCTPGATDVQIDFPLIIN